MVKIEITQQKGYNFLWIDDYLWMWDIPGETECQEELAKKAYGDVLNIGYGLGVIHKYLKENPKVKTISTIEKHKEVVDKCKEVFGEVIGEVIIDDFYNYSGDRKFDCVIGDAWAEVHPKSLKDYLKFKKNAQKFLKNNGKILAWGQDYFEYLLNQKRHQC
ncbi:MAG: methyltransferase [archaeon]|nr:MAG: methyltransferase [archaeon]